MNNHLYVLTHGYFGLELLKSAAMIVGELENVKAFSLEQGMSLEEYLKKINDEIKGDIGEKVFLVDLFGGTPFHAAAFMLKHEKVEIITGLSLPLLLETYNEHILNNQFNADSLIEIAQDSIRHINKIKR